MCGIIGAVAQRDVIDVLIEGLKRLEYRGYDSSGIAVADGNKLTRVRSVGKVCELEKKIGNSLITGNTGIAHTRWATHGIPSENNAHPHQSGNIAVVHNGIIENFQELKDELISKGYVFNSETDTEVIAHLINDNYKKSKNFELSVRESIARLKGAYGLAVINSDEPEIMCIARCGSPLVIGVGIGENFVASDQIALLPVTNKFIFLNEGDFACISRKNIEIYDLSGNKVERKVSELERKNDSSDKQGFSHYMLKEIHEQPLAIENTIYGSILGDRFSMNIFGDKSKDLLPKIKNIKIVACGTSYHAGLVARYWFEEYANVSCSVEIASEYRYRKSVIPDNSLFVSLSQSGETADTLEALRLSKKQGFIASLTICNVPNSSLVRESNLSFLTKAGVEIGVASTKAFVTQLVSLLVLCGSIGVAKGIIDPESEKSFIQKIKAIPVEAEKFIKLDSRIAEVAKEFTQSTSCLFLGRGINWPIAMEGALKLKEISYIHAEAYAAGELKHGPIALVDKNMPVIVIAPNNSLIEKLQSNIQSVLARNGRVYLFTDEKSNSENTFTEFPNCTVIKVPSVNELVAPIVYTIPLQLLAYHVAVLKGTDVDQPRNLAKSVTVE